MSFSILVAGQESAGTLTGTVTDSTGAVVAGASLQVHSQETGTDVRTVNTNSSGSFNITNLPAGRYTITVRDEGFQTYVARDVVLYTAEKHTMNVQLHAGQISEHVEVTAENAPIQTTTAEQSGTVTGEQVRELALNNRNFEQLILLQPGVTGFMGDEIGFGVNNNTAISVNGARSDANNWVVDGADINDSGSNSTLTNTPSIDAIQEFTLERSNYDASFGRSGGGQVVAQSRAPPHYMAAFTNLTAIISTTRIPSVIASPSRKVNRLPSFLLPLNAITITASRSADRSCFPKCCIRRGTRPSSSGPKSGEKCLSPELTACPCRVRNNLPEPSPLR